MKKKKKVITITGNCDNIGISTIGRIESKAKLLILRQCKIGSHLYSFN